MQSSIAIPDLLVVFLKGKRILENWRKQTRLNILPLLAQTFLGILQVKFLIIEALYNKHTDM